MPKRLRTAIGAEVNEYPKDIVEELSNFLNIEIIVAYRVIINLYDVIVEAWPQFRKSLDIELLSVKVIDNLDNVHLAFEFREYGGTASYSMDIIYTDMSFEYVGMD